MSLSEIWSAGDVLLAAKKRKQFIDYTEKALRTLPQSEVTPAYCIHFDRLIFTCQQLNDAREVAERCAAICAWDFERNGETAWGLLGRGVAAMAEDDLDSADTYITLSAGKSPSIKRATIALGVFNHRPPGYLLRLYSEGIAPGLACEFSFEPDHHARPDDIIHLVCCDSGYLRQFARPAMLSSRAAGEALFHIHLVNPTPDDIAYVRALEADIPGRLNISTERSPFVEELAVGRERAGYLINPRFIHAPTLLDFYNRPLLVSDIDAAITLKWQEIKALLEPFDVGIRRVAGHYPWRRNAAGSSYFAPTANGKLFAELASLYIRSALDLTTHKVNWLIDQNALFCAERAAGMLGANLHTQALTISPYDFTLLAQHFAGGKEAFKSADHAAL